MNVTAKSLVLLYLRPCVFVVLPPAAQVYEELEVGGAFDDGNISRSNLFLSIHDAIVFAQQTSGERQVSPKVGSPPYEITVSYKSFS